MRTFLITFVPALAIVSLSTAAHADPAADPAAARALFSEARQLAEKQKYDLACPKFEESLRLDYGVGTLFNLADCWEHLGRTASAWARFLDASAGARSGGQTDRERVARERAAALEPKLSRLTVDVKKPEAGLEIKRDGQPIGKAAWGTAVPVDPGAHQIEATAPGKKPWSTRIDVGAKAAAVAVAVPALEDATREVSQPAAPATPAPTLDTGAAPTPDTGDTGSAGAWNTQKTVGVSLAGAGVVGLVVGTVFSFVSKSKNESAVSICADGSVVCSDDDVARHQDFVDSARSARTAAYVGFGVGGAALVAGAAVFFTAPSKASGSVAFVPLAGPRLFGAGLSGAW